MNASILAGHYLPVTVVYYFSPLALSATLPSSTPSLLLPPLSAPPSISLPLASNSFITPYSCFESHRSIPHSLLSFCRHIVFLLTSQRAPLPWVTGTCFHVPTADSRNSLSHCTHPSDRTALCICLCSGETSTCPKVHSKCRKVIQRTFMQCLFFLVPIVRTAVHLHHNKTLSLTC